MKKKWTLTAKAKAAIPDWNERWIKTILSSKPIDFDKTAEAVIAMYQAAGLRKPDSIVRVASPIMGAFVCAAASVYWRHSDTTGKSTHATAAFSIYEATRNATGKFTHAAAAIALENTTRFATDNATDHATYIATGDATYNAVRNVPNNNARLAADIATYSTARSATDNAMESVARNATLAATDIAAERVTERATLSATLSATNLTIAPPAIIHNIMFQAAADVVNQKLGKDVTQECLAEAHRWIYCYNGGSEWASWCCYLSFVRDVIGFSCPEQAAYAHYEAAAIHGGGRFLHSRFALLCDRPTRQLDDQLRPHSTEGPSLKWLCGTTMWHIHGIQVDEQIALRPHTQTIAQIDGETNEDVRAVRLERFGWDRYLEESKAHLLDCRKNEIEGTHECLFQTSSGPVLAVTCPTGKLPALRVPPGIKTCLEAQRWLGSNEDGKIRVIART